MTKQLTATDSIRNALTVMKPQFLAALPSHIKPDKFIRVAMTAIQNAPKLLNCNRTSLFGACVKCAQAGLLPDGREAALVPFKDQVVYMPMVGGLLKMVRNSGELKSIGAELVYTEDEFSYYIDTDGPHLLHRPKFTGERGSISHVYAVAKMKDDGVYIEVMSKADIEKVRNVSRSKNNGPWTEWWEEMAKKTVFKRLCKRLPMSTDVELIFSKEDESLAYSEPDPIQDADPDLPPEEKPRSRAADIVASKTTKTEPKEVESETVEPADSAPVEHDGPPI